jgi:hypothetical protein
LLVILLDGGNVALVEAATAVDADTVVVVEGADTEEVFGSITVLEIKKHKSMC